MKAFNRSKSISIKMKGSIFVLVTALFNIVFLPSISFSDDEGVLNQQRQKVQSALRDAKASISQKASRYRIQPGDALEVLVWKEPELSKELLVAPDGYVSFPLIGQVSAKGASVAEFQAELTKRLSDYIPEPSVTVVLMGVLGNKFYVLGKVNRPGEFAMSYPISVLQALSMAGGMSTYADTDKIRIIRKTNHGEQSIRFDYDEIVKGKGLEQNVQLQSGDVLLVP